MAGRSFRRPIVPQYYIEDCWIFVLECKCYLEHYPFLISKMRSLQVLWGFFKHADITAFANAKSKIWQTFSVLLRESGQGKKFLLLLKWSIRHETNCKRLVALRSPLNLALREDLSLGSQKQQIFTLQSIVYKKLEISELSECTANIFNVIFTVFKCVPISTVISLYILHLIVKLIYYSFFTVTSTLDCIRQSNVNRTVRLQRKAGHI